jgi:hypothetical protein
METEEKIKKLKSFKALVQESRSECTSELRSEINQQKVWARQQVIEAGCFHTLTLGPPPAVGGLIMRDIDPFAMIFQRPYLQDLSPQVIDMIDQAIGVLLAGPTLVSDKPTIKQGVMMNYAFVAMPIDESDHELEDVLDAIKEASDRCGVKAERVDEPQSNERITDRIIESIDKAEFVIADLTKQRPNVYWEAGYAHGIGKTPIYIAKKGTQLEFDLKDYPVIFFRNMKDLKDQLESRIKGIASR